MASIQVLPENKRIFDAMGITHWHEGGYKGKNGLTITYERPVIYPIMNGQVENLWTDQFPVIENLGDSYQSHAYFTAMTHLQVAPERNIKSVITYGTKYADGTYAGPMVDLLLPWLLQNKPDTGFRSLKTIGGDDGLYKDVMTFCALCNSAGNDGYSDYATAMVDKSWWGIAAAFFDNNAYDADQTPFHPEGYSSLSEYVDFTSIGWAYAPATNGVSCPFNGTSCAAPFFSGMVALVNDFFYQKIGRPLTTIEMYEFVKSNCKDLNFIYDGSTPGKDPKTGWGIFVLPPYESIDISQYTTSTGDDDDMAMTQEQFNTMADSYFKNLSSKGPDGWSAEARAWAESNGIIFGDETGNKQYKGFCTREQMVVFLHRLAQKV